MYYGARFYDPALGRFSSADTLIPEQIQGTQARDRYAGMNNNPVRYSDPTGHDVCDEEGNCYNQQGEYQGIKRRLETRWEPVQKQPDLTTHSPTPDPTADSVSPSKLLPTATATPTLDTPIPTPVATPPAPQPGTTPPTPSVANPNPASQSTTTPPTNTVPEPPGKAKPTGIPFDNWRNGYDFWKWGFVRYLFE